MEGLIFWKIIKIYVGDLCGVIAVFSAVSGVELAMAKEHHKCKIL